MSDFVLPRREALKASAGLVSVAAVGLPAAEPWKAQTLDDHQLRTVEALGELIIPATDTPGAKAAGVHRYVDLFLADGPDGERARFLDGLGWLDGYTNNKYKKTFLNLGADDQIKVLQLLDSDNEAGVAEGHRFFRMVKSMVSRIYYNTEIGYKELNKGGRVPASYGCKP
ncbi:gluconate 2-dehydrogenase subunit 3 family protein [Bryobacter aggregatus]|uniref:gluconate 2-dehydrogenase subunit 3 family protein n=1 Tax=Bryobacter aggregatus TaxID=360054 RepID=UPI0012BA717E|nr:gluconate 2-dehydrogenase subunit 3 family protein [Bryobacter aggregatus]